MLKQNSELRAQAREALRGKWPMAGGQPLLLLFIRLSPVVCLPFLLLDGSGLCWSDCLLHTALLF